MPRQEKQYCRGCKCTADASAFISDGQQYKQCDRCRARVHDRKRSDATIVCECGREMLRTSVRDYLSTLYHKKRMNEKRMNEKRPMQQAQKAQDVVRTLMPTDLNQQQMQLAVIQRAKLLSACSSTPIHPLKPASFVLRKATVAAPMTSEPLRAKQTVQQGHKTTPVNYAALAMNTTTTSGD